MRNILIYFFLLFFTPIIILANDYIYSLKQISTFVMEPDNNSPIIYPLELGHKMKLKKEVGEWYNVLDEITGIEGWVAKSEFGFDKPSETSARNNFEDSFSVFRERVLEMSKSIKEAIGVETFLEIKHLGGVSASIVASDEWFKGRRHQGQAFQVYEMWKNQNQTPSFLSFKNKRNEEQFIVMSGPHRPRLLRSNKNP